MSWSLPIVAAAAMLPLSAHSADMAKEGTETHTNTWMGTSPTTPIKVGDHTVGTYEISGIRHNDNPDAVSANMALRCLGIYETVGTGPQRGRGSCIYTDKDGDQIMSTYEPKSESGGIETLVAGTGKFAGISGTAEYTVVQILVKADDKLIRGVVTDKVHWKLP